MRTPIHTIDWVRDRQSSRAGFRQAIILTTRLGVVV